MLEPGCELPVATVGAGDTSDASETSVFRDIPAILVTVIHPFFICSRFLAPPSHAGPFTSAQMLAKELHDMDSSTRYLTLLPVRRSSPKFRSSRPSHWNCTLVEEALILLLRLNNMLQVRSSSCRLFPITSIEVQFRFGNPEGYAPKSVASDDYAREPHHRRPQRRAQSILRLKIPIQARRQYAPAVGDKLWLTRCCKYLLLRSTRTVPAHASSCKTE